MKRYISISFALLVLCSCIYAEDWRDGLSMVDKWNPPFMLKITDEQVKRGVVAWSEIKHIDVIKVQGTVVYLTWCGRLFDKMEGAITDFIAVNAQYSKLKGKDMYDIANMMRVRFIGEFTKDEVAQIYAAMCGCSSGINKFYYGAEWMIYYNGKWRSEARIE